MSPQLERFKRKTNEPYLANFRCPICGDSQRSRSKARGYLFTESNVLVFKCHNCGNGASFGNFLKRFNESLYNQYRLEKYREGHDTKKTQPEFPSFTPEFPKASLLDEILDRVDKLPLEHPARQYCMNRMIPTNQFRNIYYIENIADIGQLNDKYRSRIVGSEARLVIPFYNRDERLVGVTCRALGDEKVRYVSIPIVEDAPQIYNLNNVDYDKEVLCVEGPIDAMFLDNCIAVGDSNFKKLRKVFPSHVKYTLIYDNQPRNKEIVRLMRAAEENNHRVVVWPSYIQVKDINDMVKARYNVQKIIQENTYEGLSLKNAISNWKKIKE